MYLCSCNRCDGIFEDTNPQTGATVYPDYPVMVLEDHACPICKTDDDLTDLVTPQYICSNCGSNDVMSKAWLHRNKKPIVVFPIMDGDDDFCNNCNAYHSLFYVEGESAKRLKELTDVSKAFSQLVNIYFTPDELKETRRRNREQNKDTGVCATHDFYDANEIMAEAIKEVLGLDVDLRLDDHISLWNKAWAIASENEFKVD